MNDTSALCHAKMVQEYDHTITTKDFEGDPKNRQIQTMQI
jgi:hypothetical protein